MHVLKAQQQCGDALNLTLSRLFLSHSDPGIDSYTACMLLFLPLGKYVMDLYVAYICSAC